MKRIFLSGATGELGAHLTLELLRSSGVKLTCLVRAASRSDAALRLERSLRCYAPHFSLEEHAHRIEILCGDVASPWLGLGEEAWRREAARTDITLHAAALTNLLTRLSSAERANVGGTREMVRFAEATPSARLLHVSTYSVCGDKLFTPSFRFREDDWDVGQSFPHMPYQRSKFLAEDVVRRSRCAWTIVRPGHIFGDSHTGRTFSRVGEGTSFFQDVLNSARDFGCSFVSDFFFDITPVNYVSEAIRSLLEHGDRGTFHLCQGNAVRFEEVLDVMISLGVEIHKMPIESYRERLESGALSWNGKRHTSLTTQVVSRWFHLEAIRLWASGRICTAYTRSVLEPRGIFAPPTDEELLGAYFPRAGLPQAPRLEESSARSSLLG